MDWRDQIRNLGKMDDKQLVKTGILGGMALGLAALLSISIVEFGKGFAGGIALIDSDHGLGFVKLRAKNAEARLDKTLNSEESDRLLRGIGLYSQSDYVGAQQIIGEYALRGDDQAQFMVGGMYAFGEGLPVDSEEALAWLDLAVAQGNTGALRLARTIRATPDWDSRAKRLNAAVANSDGTDLNATGTTKSYHRPSPTDAQIGIERSHKVDPFATSYPNLVDDPTSVRPSGRAMGARGSIERDYGTGSASRNQRRRQIEGPSLDIERYPPILNPAGPGSYTDQIGDFYTQAGPHGVVNTRTGEFLPTN